jgi:hypothetical protein
LVVVVGSTWKAHLVKVETLGEVVLHLFGRKTLFSGRIAENALAL